MRLNYLNGEGWRAVSGLAEFTANCSPDQVLLELVKLRASQVNGCAKLRQPACQSAARSGQSEERIQNIVVWWEANCFDEREKAALA